VANTQTVRRVRLAAIIGAALVLVGGGVVVASTVDFGYRLRTGDLFREPPSPEPSPTPPPGANIAGPLNILLVGIDTRVEQPAWQPHADAVLILHVAEELDRAYLFSLPRDLLVDVPAFEEAGFGGQRTKLTNAMSFGARVPGSDRPDDEQGFALVAETVSDYTGIERFDAGAVVKFPGLIKLVDALGGIDIDVDQRVVSLHKQPDGTSRPLQPGGGGYVGPQKVYEEGMQHLEGWEVLDYARQRYIDGADYSRQRHQRQVIRALVDTIIDQDLVTDPVQLGKVIRAFRNFLVFDGRDYRVADYAYALRNLTAESVGLIGLPGQSVFAGGAYQGEQLRPVAEDLFEAVREDRVEDFLEDHPELVEEPAVVEAKPDPSGTPDG
jgi:anionic cell wall polymer biosynthesis LytR-Cps2A-Psr (LCP) family protein